MSALCALRFHERRDHFGHQVRVFFLLRSGRRTIATLRRERAEVLRAVPALAEVYQQQGAGGPGRRERVGRPASPPCFSP